jgi:hypothetical protein
MYFTCRPDRRDDGLGLPHCIPLPLTAMSSAARARSQMSYFLNYKWVTIFYITFVLENNF